MKTVHLDQWKYVLVEVAEAIAAHEKDLNALDSLIGDGDHGSSMKRGFEAAKTVVSETSFASIGELFSKISRAMISQTGGAIGPLLGSFFSAAVKPAKDLTEIDLSTWSLMFSAGVDRISSFGKAKTGDKTILDALQPASDTFQEAVRLDLPMGLAFRNATAAAQDGADLTSEMIAKFGRAKFLGERSLGHPDPGANSMALMLGAMAESLFQLDQPGDVKITDEGNSLSIEAKSIEVKLTKHDPLLEISSERLSHTLKLASPLTFTTDTEDLVSLTSCNGWHLEDNQVFLACENTIENIKAYLIITFPLETCCQVEILSVSNNLTKSSVRFKSSIKEQFFGGGEHFSTADLRGKRIEMWTDDRGTDQKPDHAWTYWPVPFFLSNQGYGLLVHNIEKSIFDLCAADPEMIEIVTYSPNLCFETFWADQPIDNLGLLLRRTGLPPLPPKWNNGVWVTCLGGEEAVIEKARLLRKEHIPCSALWVYDAHDPQRNIGWPICPMHHSGVYHDVPRLVDQLHQMGYKVQTYLFPYFYVGTALFDEADKKGYFLKRVDGSTYQFPFWKAIGRQGVQVPASILDFTNPEAKAWWQSLLRFILIDLGYDGWMHDFGEAIPEGVVANNGLKGNELHNIYPVMYQQAAREVCLQVKPDASFYARSGFTGSQTWLTAAWTGDQICTWEKVVGLSSALTACLSLSLSGMFFIGPDIGGYFGRGLPQEADSFSKELWIRWTQLCAFSTVMRDHLGDKPDGSVELWTDHETMQVFKEYAWLHMSLSPYIQSCARHAVRDGHPIMRHMFLVEPKNPSFWQCDDQYLFGDAILVAPILDYGARSRRVLLPVGRWISFWDGEIYEGSQDITLPAPLNQIPLLVKEGTVIPMLLNSADTLVESTDASVISASENLKLKVFLPKDWKNDNETKFVATRVLVDGTFIDSVRAKNTYRLKVNSSLERTYLIVIPAIDEPKSCSLNGYSLSRKQIIFIGDSWHYDRDSQEILVRCTTVDVDLEISY
jgi:dihydroxyacetone kinase phosphoprotein-dependent L subunit